MPFNWQTLLLSVCLSQIGAQLFEKPSTLTTTNVTYTSYIQGAVGGATQLPNHVNVQRAPAIQIIKAAEQEITDSDALAPLLQQLLRQTMPNWQQEQRQQQQQQHQHFFVFENSQPVQLAGQQPQILQGFNGVNVRQPQQQQELQQQPHNTLSYQYRCNNSKQNKRNTHNIYKQRQKSHWRRLQQQQQQQQQQHQHPQRPQHPQQQQQLGRKEFVMWRQLEVGRTVFSLPHLKRITRRWMRCASAAATRWRHQKRPARAATRNRC
ncbi:uncharacterized protein Dvir_GJ24075 [Drosophila virilis]|uniref:Uncharacterized protein n=1 Tax=Drosophila virilis TaxID=7244 RepID=A0A0Q9WSU7_DROVI|nr:uncharacterized protein Dvir_GJ24075 [Drosophila virilis]